MQRSLLVCLFLGLSTACTYDDGYAGPLLQNAPNCGGVSESKIDTDALIQVTPGDGAGLFTEYATGGHFHVRTTCDTPRSGTTCSWDVLLISDGATISNVVPESFEASDSIASVGGNPSSYHLLTTTDSDVDGVTFDVSVPGSALKVDALLDGYCAQSFIFWTGDGAIHTGPTSAVWLTPSTP